MPGTSRFQSPAGDGHVQGEHPVLESDLPHDALRLDPLAVFGRREHPFQRRPRGRREGRLPDHAVARLADLRREVRNFRHAFHFDELSRLERGRILRDVHPDPGSGVLHEHVGSGGPHVRIPPQEVRAREGCNTSRLPDADGVAARGLLGRELPDLGDVGQERKRRALAGGPPVRRRGADYGSQ